MIHIIRIPYLDSFRHPCPKNRLRRRANGRTAGLVVRHRIVPSFTIPDTESPVHPGSSPDFVPGIPVSFCYPETLRRYCITYCTLSCPYPPPEVPTLQLSMYGTPSMICCPAGTLTEIGPESTKFVFGG